MFQFQDLTLENDSQHHSYEKNGIKFNPYSFRPIEEVNQISFVREILKIMWYMFSEGISGWRISVQSLISKQIGNFFGWSRSTKFPSTLLWWCAAFNVEAIGLKYYLWPFLSAGVWDDKSEQSLNQRSEWLKSTRSDWHHFSRGTQWNR